ncbi:MAG: CHASE2 domain-containing protein [Candidatus Omnitrophica bacterium]|nr:CHASE2 domain-containing protein [Candidatus Omnitrophota bacterium]
MDFSKKRKRIALLVSALLIIASAISLSYFRVLDNYELETLDIRFRLRPPIPVNKNIAIIEIGDDTIDKLGKWPISRKYHAALVDALTQAGARAIVFDVFFSEERDEIGDLQFEEAIKKSGKVYLPYVFNIASEGGYNVPVADKIQEKLVDKFEKHAKGTGFINIIPDSDGKYRRVPLFIRYKNVLYSHVCFLVAADYLGLEEKNIQLKPGKFVVLGDKIKVPLGSNSATIVNFPGEWNKTFRRYSYIDILDSHISVKFPNITKKKPIVDMASFEGSVCFIGVTATATPDAHPSPFDSLYPGVGTNASLFNSFLIEKFIKRVGRLANVIILVLLCMVTCWIAKRAKTLLGFIFVFLFILGYIVFATALFFAWGLWIDIFCPVAVILFVYLGATFTKYISEVHKTEVLEKELSIAKKIQESFLPKEKPEVPGIEVVAKMVTALQVGGDLYDFVKLGEKKLGIMIGDVSGKGVPAALFMAKVVSDFKYFAGEETASRAIFKLNDKLCRESGSGLFVTLSYVVFDMEKDTLNYSTGGHLPMIMLRKGEERPELIDLKEGTPLGLFEGEFNDKIVEFKKGDTFILYTDGVTEAMNKKGEMFEEEGLLKLVKDNAALGIEQIVNLVQEQVKKFEGKDRQHDDITVIAVRIA